MQTETLKNFKALFDFVYQMDPRARDNFGRQQKNHNGITVGFFTRHIHFLQAEGLSVMMDTRINQIRFNEGNAEGLQSLLAQNPEATEIKSPDQLQM